MPFILSLDIAWCPFSQIRGHQEYRAAWKLLQLKGMKKNGWEAGIRTPIRRSRVCSLTVRRPPSAPFSLSSFSGKYYLAVNHKNCPMLDEPERGDRFQ